MAENNVPIANQSQVEMEEEEEQRLKYLQFVQMASVHALLYVSKAYAYAKNNSGPLKPRVETMEGKLKTAVGLEGHGIELKNNNTRSSKAIILPTASSNGILSISKYCSIDATIGSAYNKFHDVPAEALKFVDRKVDESVNKFNTQVHPFVKQVSAKTKNLSEEVKTAGVVKTAYTKLESAAKGLYTKYEPVAERYAASAWQSLNQLPVFPKVAKVVVPIAAYYSDKYNQTVQQTAEKGYKVSSYLPLVLTERISKVFNPVGPQAESVA
ncbi:stress-related protein-like [Bidens hawaiensis]|uniref:stress-related protein-like n=1 Tax=Bidens hawaiensis TaxID=980011 RepID=UPI00404AA1B5